MHGVMTSPPPYSSLRAGTLEYAKRLELGSGQTKNGDER